MATTGPIPKRSGTRLGHTSSAVANGDHVTKAPGAEKVRMPQPDPDWVPMVRELYLSLRKSGQSAFYQPSDWRVAWSLMDDLNYYKTERSGKPRSAVMLATIYSILGSLLVTEGDRRRVQLELERPDDSVSDSVVAVESYKALLAGGAKRPGQVA